MTETTADQAAPVACIIGPRPLIRTIAFDTATFDLLKTAQRKLEQRLRRDTSNSEVIKFLLYSHPAVADIMTRMKAYAGNFT